MNIAVCVLISVSLISVVILIALSRVSLEKYGNYSPASLNVPQDKLFLFDSNVCKPSCCNSGKGNTYSCSVGCVCVNDKQQQLLTRRGGNNTRN
tara:strand:- start:78 stop:359 length:282 start_codon:yes stop_codon:yes gene_type:complete